MRWSPSLIGALVLLAGCTATTPAVGPAESVPPLPQAPSGWASVGGFGGSAEGGLIGATLSVVDGALALSASCSGEGTLMVIITREGKEAESAYVAPAGVFACPDLGQVSTGRVELPDVPAGAVTVTAYVVEGLGTLRHASFNVSLEQDAADS